MFALCSFGFFIYIYLSSDNKLKISKAFAMIVLIAASILATTATLHQPIKERLTVTLGLFSSDYEKINSATALRLTIWKTAHSIFKEYPINGIGPRGFRYVYNEFAEPGDFFLETNVPPTQPHLLILEILTETGLIGLTGFLLFCYFLIKSTNYIVNSSYGSVFLIPVLVAIFPFNIHMAFYGSIWSSMIWLLIAFYVAALKLSFFK